ncbi:MAG: DUF1444 family protein [bacterium]
MLLCVGLILQGCRNDILSPCDFRAEFASTFKQTNTNLSVRIAGEMELQVKTADGGEFTVFLDNAYSEYKQDPTNKQQIIERYIGSTMESPLTGKGDAVEKTWIVPIIKDRAWVTETRRDFLARGMTNTFEYVAEDYNDQLVILYAQDSPKNIRYLKPEDVTELKIPREALRPLACDNLRRLLPKIELMGTNGLYMMTAGGAYESSLLLLDSIWTNHQFTVKGDYVVAIPTRDLLLIGGSDDPVAISKIKILSKKAAAEGSYRLTDELFVYRNGRFKQFDK